MRKTSLLIAMVLVMSLAGWAQGTTGKCRMKGTVLDDKTGLPLEGVTVKMFSLKVNLYAQPFPKTDAEGKWKAMYILPGLWNLDFEKAGYETYKASCRVDSNPNAKEPDMLVRLRKIEGMAVSADVIGDLEKGNQLFLDKKYPEAVACFEGALAKFPDTYIISKYIGNCYFAMENYDRAVENYQKVVAKQPGSSELMVLIGNAYNNAGKNDQAMEWYQRVPLTDIKDIDTLYNIGVNFYNHGKNEQAVEYFKSAVSIDPEFADGFYQLGMTYTALNRIAEATEALNRFMTLAPDSPNFGTAKAIVDAFSKVK